MRSVSLPAHSSATSSAQGPVVGPSLVRTSTPNSPGAVTAAFRSGSRSNASLDDTIHGYVDLGDVSDSDVIFMGDQPMPQDATSGDDSDTMDADVNWCSPDPLLLITQMGYCSTPQGCPPLTFSTRCGLTTCLTTSRWRQTITTIGAQLRVTTINSVSFIILLMILIKWVHIYIQLCLWN